MRRWSVYPAKKQQIPFGDDNKKDHDKSKDNDKAKATAEYSKAKFDLT